MAISKMGFPFFPFLLIIFSILFFFLYSLLSKLNRRALFLSIPCLVYFFYMIFFSLFTSIDRHSFLPSPVCSSSIVATKRHFISLGKRWISSLDRFFFSHYTAGARVKKFSLYFFSFFFVVLFLSLFFFHLPSHSHKHNVEYLAKGTERNTQHRKDHGESLIFFFSYICVLAALNIWNRMEPDFRKQLVYWYWHWYWH
ncbi:hypothetical protein VTN96DRAFT_5147 [Rasamsonia emersonii]